MLLRLYSKGHTSMQIINQCSSQSQLCFTMTFSLYRVGSERAPSPTLSSVSEWTECFVEQPTNFKTEATYHLDQR